MQGHPCLFHLCALPSVALQVVGNFCMDLAIKKAKEHGIGWIVCKGQCRTLNSNCNAKIVFPQSLKRPHVLATFRDISSDRFVHSLVILIYYSPENCTIACLLIFNWSNLNSGLSF